MTMYRKTFAGRLNATIDMLLDPDLDLGPKEFFRHYYHVVMYERALVKIKKGKRAQMKHADILNADIAAFSMRKRMKDL